MGDVENGITCLFTCHEGVIALDGVVGAGDGPLHHSDIDVKWSRVAGDQIPRLDQRCIEKGNRMLGIRGRLAESDRACFRAIIVDGDGVGA